MRLVPLMLIVAPLALAACSPAAEPASAPQTPAEASATPPVPPTQTTDPALDNAVADFLGDNAASTRTVVRVVGDRPGRVALVYLVGMNWCGTGGCNLLILRPGATGWEPVGNISRVSNPVRLLATSSNGLPDIGVTVSGGGGPPPYEAKVAFDGRAYPRFPSDEPLVGAEGTVVISDADILPPAQ